MEENCSSFSHSLVLVWVIVVIINDNKEQFFKDYRRTYGLSSFGDVSLVYLLDLLSLPKRMNDWDCEMSRMIADCTKVEERNKYMSRLEATISAAFIIGPAFGGFLGSKNYSYPLFFAGIVAGIALIFASTMMHETNKDVQTLQELKREMKGKNGGMNE